MGQGNCPATHLIAHEGQCFEFDFPFEHDRALVYGRLGVGCTSVEGIAYGVAGCVSKQAGAHALTITGLNVCFDLIEVIGWLDAACPQPFHVDPQPAGKICIIAPLARRPANLGHRARARPYHILQLFNCRNVFCPHIALCA